MHPIQSARLVFYKRKQTNQLFEKSFNYYYLVQQFILTTNIVTNLMRNVTSKRELWPKKPIFLHKKHENQPPNQKVVLPTSPFFQTGSNYNIFQMWPSQLI